jgi:hypothetical protein
MSRLFLFFVLIPALFLAEVREVRRIADLFLEVRSDSIVLMDIDETLIESSIMLGSKAWRGYAAHHLQMRYSSQKARDLLDKITYWIAQRVPCIAVESDSHLFLNQLKEKQIPVFGFTARGKKYWHTMPCADGEEIACLHLRQAGFDLDTLSQPLSEAFLSHPSYAKGIFFSPHPFVDKGTFALEVFAQTRPAHVLFVDDKLDNVHSMDSAFAKLHVPALCFYYPHVDMYRSFDPIIAAIQLEKLYRDKQLLSDREAALLKANYAHRDPDLIFLEWIQDFACSFQEMDECMMRNYLLP